MDQSDKLAELLADFAHTLGEDFHVQDILDHLVKRIVDVLPVTAAGVMLMGDADELHFLAASNDTIRNIERLQNELAEGPCLEAYRSGKAVSIPDLSRDENFAQFSPRANQAGLAAVFTFPMSQKGVRFGALDLYRDTAGELQASDLAAAHVLADVAAAYIQNARRTADARDHLDVVRQRSLHDPLTGLPNRTLLRERLEQAVARANRSRKLVAVLFVDLDRFKTVNDRYGHQVGDRLLISVSGRLKRVLRAGDTLARLSGDEFVIMCESLEQPDQAERVAERVAAALEPVFELEGVSLQISASVGIAFCGTETDLPDNLLRDADFAMYQAKQAGGAHHQLVDPIAQLAAGQRGRLSRELRDSLAGEELRLAYQPIVDIHHGELQGVEALLRWRHPTRGWVMPDEILPVAEPSGLILAIGEWVLTQACRDLRHWKDQYGSAIPHVTVNVSPYQVMAPDFDLTVQRVLETTGTDPGGVFLEVTESAFMEDGPRALTVLEHLQELGVGLILDDFGTGYSSLNYLRKFPFDIIKIDQVFVRNLDSDADTHKIMAAIIDLAHGLDLSVVSEGVETARQLSAAAALGSDRVQGYYLCRPLLLDEFDQRILEPAGRAPVRLPLVEGSLPRQR